jgi:hypothetical protein
MSRQDTLSQTLHKLTLPKNNFRPAGDSTGGVALAFDTSQEAAAAQC